MPTVLRAIFVIACAVIVAACSSAATSPSGSGHGAGLLNRLIPGAAPANWTRIAIPAGTALLSYPPSFTPVRSDPGTVSVAEGSGSAVYQGYLNITPRQGTEELHGFADFRLDRLGDEDTQVHEIASSERVAFRAATGSCVNDDYRTRVGGNHYEEIACLVVGEHGDYVIVAAALFADWARLAPTLQMAVEAFDVH
jgi:uncharacterized membrane protein